MLLTRNTENGSNGHMIGLKLSNTDLERDWSMRVGWPFQVNQTVMQIQNVIAIINGAEESDRYCAAILVIKAYIIG
jgi:hypothetical protein